MAWRSLSIPILALMMLTAGWFVLRIPDAGQAIAFFTSGTPSLLAGEALMKVVAWLAIAVATFGAVFTMAAGKSKLPLRGNSPYVPFLLTVALVLLAVGAVQRSLPAASVCCGSGPANIREAIRLAR